MKNNKKEPDFIYHYTSIECLYKILNYVENQHIFLHLHSLSNMNDSFEGNAGLRILESYSHVDSMDNQLLEAIKNILKDKNEKEFGLFDNIFCISFSEKHDDLSQWRSYGDDCKGVSIGFNYQKIKNLKFLESTTGARLAPVEYIDVGMEQNVKNKDLVNLLNQTKKQSKNMQKQYLMGGLCFFKHNAFKNESEYRIMLNPSNIKNKDNYSREFKFYDRKIIPYYKIKVPASAIETIIIGSESACNQDINFLKQFLIHKKFNCAVANEKETLRWENNKNNKDDEHRIDLTQSKIPYIPK